METRFDRALTFDDVLLKPGYAGFLRSDITTATKLTKNITLDIPLVSAPMDTVTESKLAIALAKCGGLGFIHRNLTVKQQVAEVKKAKKTGVKVGATIGSSPGYEKRVEALLDVGADVILIDSAHGYSKQVIETVRAVRKRYKKVDLVAGNVASAEGAKALIAAGADALRVGMGPGAICSTRIVSGMGVPQITALIETTKVAKKHSIPVIADGGVNYSGDITKALSAGASVVMLGRLFAAAQESPGAVVSLSKAQVPSRFRSIINGAKTYKFKKYRGMGSVGAMKKGLAISSEDEFHGKSYKDEQLIAEGVEGMVPMNGTVAACASELIGGLTSGMYYVGAKSIPELWKTAKFLQITQASLKESHPHDLFVTESGSKYI